MVLQSLQRLATVSVENESASELTDAKTQYSRNFLMSFAQERDAAWPPELCNLSAVVMCLEDKPVKQVLWMLQPLLILHPWLAMLVLKHILVTNARR